MILFSTVDKLTALTKWPALRFMFLPFAENECNKFNCLRLTFKLSNGVNTVHVAAILRKLQQQEKVFEYCTPPAPQKGLAATVAAGGWWWSHRGGGAQKKFKMLPKTYDI